MTINADTASTQPLHTESDMVTRIRDLLAPAINPAQLWVVMLDEHGYQLPIMIPIEDRPTLPDAELLNGLAFVLSSVLDEQCDGGGSALFAVERLGPFGATNEDYCWATGLRGACERAGVAVAGTFLLSPGGVSPLTE